VDSYLDEREKWEALLSWLRANGPAMLAGVAIAALGLGGYRWWQSRVNGRDLAASALYAQMEQAFAGGNRAQAFALAGTLERQYGSTPYADQARLAAAAAYVQTGHLARAASELTDVMEHPHDAILGLIARLRLARVQIALHQPQLALRTLGGADPGAFAPRFAVVRGDAYDAMGKKREALAQYRLARASDPGGETDRQLLALEISQLAANLSGGPAKAAAPGARQAAGAAEPPSLK
jgi:predicted negative regulator of RcsB-dependent stress response